MIEKEICRYGVTDIGYVGENKARAFLFPIAKLRKEFPNATYSVVHQRNGDEAPYPCITETTEDYVKWIVQSSDVANVGAGEAQLILTENDEILKSYTYPTNVLKSLGEATDVPPPYQPWVDSVLKEFAFSHKLENITCNYISIPHSAEPHCDSEETETGLILTFYIPMGEQGIKGDKGDKGDRGEQGIQGDKGDKGEKGADGKDGADGFTPSASVTKTDSTSTITITDKVGTTSVEVKDGEKGDKGDDYILTEQDKEQIASQISTEVKPVITNDLKTYIDSTYPILDEVAL